MWLINVDTYELEFFSGRPSRELARKAARDETGLLSSDQVPPYAILSHKWGSPKDEVSFQDMRNLPAAKQKPGFRKIRWSCVEARKASTTKVRHVWIDTW
jgi:hypothetical protein